jgi:hypothetical protein
MTAHVASHQAAYISRLTSTQSNSFDMRHNLIGATSL